MQANTKFVILEIENLQLGKNDPIDKVKSLSAKLFRRESERERELSYFIILHTLFIHLIFKIFRHVLIYEKNNIT